MIPVTYTSPFSVTRLIERDQGKTLDDFLYEECSIDGLSFVPVEEFFEALDAWCDRKEAPRLPWSEVMEILNCYEIDVWSRQSVPVLIRLGLKKAEKLNGAAAEAAA